MKTTLKLLLAAFLAVFCCFNTKAQGYLNAIDTSTLVYSNTFNGSAVDIQGAVPQYINPNAIKYGGTNIASFIRASNNVPVGFFANQDGTMGNQLDSVLLTNNILPGFVYTIHARMTIVTQPPGGGWTGIGFIQGIPAPRSSYRISDIGNRFVWALLNYQAQGGGTVLGSGGGNGAVVFSGVSTFNNLMNTLGAVNTVNLSLDTTGAKWIVSENINGTFVGSMVLNTTPVGLLNGFGYTQTTTTAGAYKYSNLSLYASSLVITTNPVSATVSAGSAYTNTIQVACTSPGFQWYTNNVPVNGANTNILVFNPVSTANASANIYCVITNSDTTVTSAVVSLAVVTAPTIAATTPTTYNNSVASDGAPEQFLTLFGGYAFGTTNYPGSTPTFTVTALGQAPLTYMWLTNGVAVGGATGISFTATNCSLTGPTNFTCVVTNSLGSATNEWVVSYVSTPPVAYMQLILSNTPTAFWRLNETPDDGNGDQGLPALDFASGNNGLYQNGDIGYVGYTNVGSSFYTNPDTNNGSAQFGIVTTAGGEIKSIRGVDFATNGSATFTIQAWVKAPAQSISPATIIAKGAAGNEQFALDVNGGKWRFLIRTNLAVAESITAATGPDNAWHLLVGVCDEPNKILAFYVDGLSIGTFGLTAGTIIANTNLVTIGSRPANPLDFTDAAQFTGNISDVVVYKNALSSGQIASLWQAFGGQVGFQFLPPLPPTNFVFQGYGTFNTITLPATVIGPAPMGYYWTNMTIGGIVASGRTNVFGNMNCTLTIPNASPSLSGDTLELVVTNAASSTNWFTTLFSPGPPVQLGYANTILYSNNFNGGLWSVEGQPMSAANLLVTNNTWHVVSNNVAGGWSATANGSQGANSDSIIVPFTPNPGYVYTLEGSLTFLVTPPTGGWSGLGFSGTYASGYTPEPRIMNNWTLLNMFANGGGSQLFSNAVVVASVPSLMTALNTPYDIKLVLDTTGAQWSLTLYVAGTLVGSASYPTKPVIQSFGYTQTGQTAGDTKWNYISFTQVAPDGSSAGAPYPLNPSVLPTGITVGAGNPLSIPATAYGAVPVGYSWNNTNTAAVLGSGTTNNLAPLIANLSVGSVPGSWNGNTLSLVLTNAYGTNISYILLTVTNGISLNVTNIGLTMSNGNLYLSWPTDHTGYTLQAQTNSLSVGISTNWVDVPASTVTNQVVFPVNPANPSVFYRLYLNH